MTTPTHTLLPNMTSLAFLEGIRIETGVRDALVKMGKKLESHPSNTETNNFSCTCRQHAVEFEGLVCQVRYCNYTRPNWDDKQRAAGCLDPKECDDGLDKIDHNVFAVLEEKVKQITKYKI